MLYLLINPPYPLLVLFGLVAGSFISMWSYRLPRNRSIFGRSNCDTCNRTIGVTENIPILSYLLSKGRCRGCKSKISVRYPLIEIATAFCFVSTAYFFNTLKIIPPILAPLEEYALPVALLTLTCLITSLVVDLEEQILPDQISLILGILTAILLITGLSPLFYVNLLAGFLVFVFFLLIYLITKGRGMGFGDVKLVPVLGSLLGLQTIVVWLNLAFVSGAIIGVLLLLTKQAKIHMAIPFGPFLIVSAWISLFFSQDISNWYISLFL